MCDPATAALIASTVLTAGGTAMSYDAQRDQQVDFNNKTAANNRRMEDQYAIQQAQQNAARDQIDRTVDREVATQQDFSAQKQTTLAEEMQKLAMDAQEANRQDATARRMDTFDNASFALSPSLVGAEGPKVVQDRAAAARATGEAEGRSMVQALSGLGAMNDGRLTNAFNTTEIGRALNDIARKSVGSLEMVNGRVGGLNRSIAASTGRPYDTVPVYPKSGVSGIGTLLQGAGDIGMTAAMLSNPTAKPSAPVDSKRFYPIPSFGG